MLRLRYFSLLTAMLTTAWLGARDLRASGIPVSLSSDALPSAAAATTSRWKAVVPAGYSGLEYQFAVVTSTGVPNVLRSFHSSDSFEWTPMLEGTYQVIAGVRDSNGNPGEARSTFLVSSRLVQPGVPTISTAGNPLVAIYSAPACNDGSIRVMFHPEGSSSKQYTPYKKCSSGKSLNFFVAGMLPRTRYVLQQEGSLPGTILHPGPDLTFQTGAIPASANVPVAVVMNPKDAQTDASQSVLLTSYLAALPGQSSTPVATDARGRVIWYSYSPDKPLRYLIRPLAGGTMFVLLQDQTILREIDLAGNTVRETNTGWISEQLQRKFGMPAVTSFHHDAVRLANGSIAAIASVEKIFNGIQGSSGPVDVLGDAIVVMDQNFNVTWAWNSFDQLDVTRRAVMGETCATNQPGCPPVLLASTIGQTTAADWLHSNSLDYLADGNFILSMRHQDWVIKIDYRNGAGNGAVLWRLGKDGDFTMTSSDPFPWFSHQHSASFNGNSLWLFDNGNTRHSADANATSRGQVFQLNESTRTASIMLSADLGSYSPALGSAEHLQNGNYHFLSGNLSSGHSQSMEIVPDPGPAGKTDFLVDAANPAYRSFRMRNIFAP